MLFCIEGGAAPSKTMMAVLKIGEGPVSLGTTDSLLAVMDCNK